MKRRYIYPALVILVTVSFYYVERYIDNQQQEDFTVDKDNSEKSFYLPTSTTGNIVKHTYYTLSYSEKHEQPEWVAYQLKKEHLSKNEFKRPYFEEDTKVRTSSADWRNYKNSGYDRGHLCPAGDRRFSWEAYEETFLTSNISPQEHKFNSGIWNRLEQKIRYWTKMYDDLYVITGGVLEGNLNTIGYEQVSVPKYFYKIIFRNDSDPKVIAFLFPHQESRNNLEQFVVSVDRLEEITNIDFFEALNDQLENKLESAVIKKNWKF